jgi:hypothetical protein
MPGIYKVIQTKAPIKDAHLEGNLTLNDKNVTTEDKTDELQLSINELSIKSVFGGNIKVKNKISIGDNDFWGNVTGVIIGNTTALDNIQNASVAIGYNALGNNIYARTGNLNTGQLNIGIGYTAGSLNVDGSHLCFFGPLADIDDKTKLYNNSTALGAYAKISDSNEIVLGGAPYGIYPTVKIPNLNTNGVVHTDTSGNLTTRLIENNDIIKNASITDDKLATITTAGKVNNSATTATTSGIPNSIVLRDSNGFISGLKNLTLGQYGDEFGNTYLHLRNRVGENGAIFETTGPKLVDFIFKYQTDQRNIRLEGRSEYGKLGANTWHIGGKYPTMPQLAISDSRVAVKEKLCIGNYLDHTETLCVNGKTRITDTLNLSNLNSGIMRLDGSKNVMTSNILSETDIPNLKLSGKVENSATTATTKKDANTIVLRDSNGRISNQIMTNNCTGQVYYYVKNFEVTLDFYTANVFLLDIAQNTTIKFSNMLPIQTYGENASKITLYVKIENSITDVIFDKKIGWKNDYNPFSATNIGSLQKNAWHRIEIDRIFYEGNEIFFGTHNGYYNMVF